jgi:uncharacterized protein (TIGR03083 family)
MPTPEARAGTPAPDLLPALAAAQEAFAGLLDGAELDRPVATCGTWTVADLALHLGGVHRWAAGMARGTDDGGDDPTGPREPTALRAFYREQAALLRRTLAGTAPDAPALTLLGPGPAAFWHRRQLHETQVHLHDLAVALDAPQPAGDPGLWADAVDEVVTTMMPRQVRLGRIAAPTRPVRLVARDTTGTWELGGTASDATVEVAGSARTLALLLWGRARADDPDLTVRGDAGALHDALARALTP